MTPAPESPSPRKGSATGASSSAASSSAASSTSPSASTSSPDPAGPAVSRLPSAWRAQHAVHQSLVLLIAGVAALAITWRSPILEAFLEAIPVWVTPWGFALPWRILVPLLVPVVVAVPLVFTRHRAPLLLWVALMCTLAIAGVLEVARLNWFAFAGGVAFRVESGPVPLVRSLGGLALILCGVLLMALQSAHHHLALLAERGVPRGELAVVRTKMLKQEQVLVAGAFVAGAGLLLVAALSMRLTERPPAEAPWFVPALVWVGLLLGVVAGVVAVLARSARPGVKEE